MPNVPGAVLVHCPTVPIADCLEPAAKSLFKPLENAFTMGS